MKNLIGLFLALGLTGCYTDGSYPYYSSGSRTTTSVYDGKDTIFGSPVPGAQPRTLIQKTTTAPGYFTGGKSRTAVYDGKDTIFGRPVPGAQPRTVIERQTTPTPAFPVYYPW